MITRNLIDHLERITADSLFVVEEGYWTDAVASGVLFCFVSGYLIEVITRYTIFEGNDNL